MRTSLFLLLVLPVLLSVAHAMGGGTTADFVVAPNGDDRNPGRVDKPFATLERAKQAVRQIKMKNRPVTVLLRGGMYYLAEPVTFTAEDSGTANAPITYAAWPGETPVLSGGVKITQWKKEGMGILMARLPEVQAKRWEFRQLFVNGQRRPRPRLPKEGYLQIKETVPPTDNPTGKGYDRFRFKPGDIRANWHNLSDIEVITFHPWFISMLRIGSVDTKKDIVTFTGKTRTGAKHGQLLSKLRYLVENVKEALSPGQWYLDRKTGELTCSTWRGEKLLDVVAPRLEKLIVLEGDPGGKAVEHLKFRGLGLTHSNWITDPLGSSMTQAAIKTSGAFYATYARYILVEKCVIQHTGGYAMELAAGCRDVRVEACRMTDLGAGGVKIGTHTFQEDIDDQVSRIVVRDNTIAHGGRIHAEAVGVWIGHADHCLVEHNDIYDLYYTGISVGWIWGYASSGAHHNIIQLNHIHHIGQSVLSDMGGIYTLGLSPGTVLRLNRIHDVNRYVKGYGGWGIYFDEGTSNIIAEKNLIYRTEDAGFHQHYGQENIFRNNIIARTRNEALVGTRIVMEDRQTIQKKKAFTFEHNIICGWGASAPDAKGWPDERTGQRRSFYTLWRNLWWNNGKPVIVPKRDHGSLVADPLFVDPTRDDYRLRDKAPALRIGFKMFDISRAGRLHKEPADLDAWRWPGTYPPTR